MSGYLQRLVNAATGRDGGVQPRTGSIFSPPREEAFSRLPDLESTATASTAPSLSRVRAARPDADSAVDPPPPVARRSRPEARPDRAPDVPVSVAVTPPAHESAPHETDPFVPVFSAVVPGERSVTPPRRQSPTGDLPSTPIDQPHAAGDRERLPESTVMRPADSARKAAVARTIRKADDVQIHIGRIEVVAVPPPAPRAPGPDRSPSLDAYLNRRHGGSR